MTEQQTTETEVEEIRPDDGTNEEVATDVASTESGNSEQADEGRHETPTPEEEHDEEPDTFPRSVVEKLRKENAGYREKAKKAETYARELFHARVAATGRLADADDLPFDEALLEDHDALLAAVEDLLARKPHLASRTPRGDVGAGALSEDAATVDLAGILRSRA